MIDKTPCNVSTGQLFAIESAIDRAIESAIDRAIESAIENATDSALNHPQHPDSEIWTISR
jgi:hypothetical protein